MQPSGSPTLRPLADTAAANRLTTRTFSALLPLANGQLLAGDDFGLFALTLPNSVPSSQLRPLLGPGLPPALSVSALLATPTGRVWIGSPQGCTGWIREGLGRTPTSRPRPCAIFGLCRPSSGWW